MTNKALFISFEGIDYSGKSTQIDLLTKKLEELGKPYITLREPGGTVIGEKIRDILLDREADEMTPETELLLYSAARAQLVRQEVIPHLEKGYVVILDRFFDSTLAYQGYGRDLPVNKIEQITDFAVEMNVPDLTFYLRLTVEEMKKRKNIAGRTDDRLEANSHQFFEKIISGYDELSVKYRDRFISIDAGKPEEDVFIEIWNKVESYL